MFGDDEEKASRVHNRIIKKRRRDCRKLGEKDLLKIFTEQRRGVSAPSIDSSPCDKLMHILKESYRIALEDDEETEKRRDAFKRIERISLQIDIAVEHQRRKRLEDAERARAAKIAHQEGDDNDKKPKAKPRRGTEKTGAASEQPVAKKKPPPESHGKAASASGKVSKQVISQANRNEGDVSESSPSSNRQGTSGGASELASNDRAESPDVMLSSLVPKHGPASSNPGRSLTTAKSSPRSQRPMVSSPAAGKSAKALAKAREKAQAPIYTGPAKPFVLKPSPAIQDFMNWRQQKRKEKLTLGCCEDHALLLNARQTPVEVKFDRILINEEQAKQVDNRLRRWDPYWEPLSYLCVGMTNTVEEKQPLDPLVQTAGSFQFNPTQQKVRLDRGRFIELGMVKGLNWGNVSIHEHGHLALLFRMMPVEVPKKKGDVHLWPKGTLVEVSSPEDASVMIPVRLTTQRKQQRYDPKKFLGLSTMLDLVGYVHDAKEPFRVQISCFDTEKYYFTIALCRYHSPDMLCRTLLSHPKIPHLTAEQGKAEAQQIAKKTTVVLDSDSDRKEANRLTFSLACKMSMTIMRTPVKSVCCEHFARFDLHNYLETNSTVSGTRWRCPFCQNFVSIYDLQLCQWTKRLLQTYKASLSSSRNQVELLGDSVELLPEAMPYRKKRSSTVDPESNKVKRSKPSEDEIIVID